MYGRADSTAARLLATRSITYVPELSGGRYWSVQRPRTTALATSGYDWLVEVESNDTGTVAVGRDSLRYAGDSTHLTFTVTGRAGDTLRFSLAAVAQALADSGRGPPRWNDTTFIIPATTPRFRGLLALRSVHRNEDVRIAGWAGQLLLAPR